MQKIVPFLWFNDQAEEAAKNYTSLFKNGRQLARDREKLHRYFQYAEAVTVSIEADIEGDLERVIDYLQQSLPGKVKVTRRVKEAEEVAKPDTGRYRARLKITLG